MSGLRIRRRPHWRVLLRALPFLALLALTATLAGALQVRDIRVVGASRFPAREVELALRSALGTPTVAARPEALRELVQTVPWVKDARVRISLDGIVTCTVTERTPVAVAVDGSRRTLVDAAGELLGPAEPNVAGLELAGFGPYPVEREHVLARVAAWEEVWGAHLLRVVRVGPQDVELAFADTHCLILTDPADPALLTTARRVLAAWLADRRPEPVKIDVRLGTRVAVTPAPAPTGEASS
ncbi:MAG: cell division protein FtsQ/DivIB [Acidobacteriota bacterium]